MAYIEFAHTTSSPAYQTARILERLGYGEKDLDQNRQGRLSPRQIKKLFLSEVATSAITAVLLLLLWVAIALAAGAWVPEGSETPTALRICKVGALLGMLLQLLRLPRNLVVDLIDGKVQQVQGRPTHRVTEKKIKIDANKELMPFDSFVINGVDLPIKTYLLEVIEDVNPYVFYYTPRSKHLVGAEPYVPLASRAG